jgi:hypothetical protein
MRILQNGKADTIYVNGKTRTRFSFVNGVCEVEKMKLDKETLDFCLNVLEKEGYIIEGKEEEKKEVAPKPKKKKVV